MQFQINKRRVYESFLDFTGQDWKNLPDQPGFHQTDTIWEQKTNRKKYKFLSLNVI